MIINDKCQGSEAFHSVPVKIKIIAGLKQLITFCCCTASWSVFVHCCRERAAADTSQMKELEAILAEARDLEGHLKEKKKQLKKTLALISDKLEG